MNECGNARSPTAISVLIS